MSLLQQLSLFSRKEQSENTTLFAEQCSMGKFFKQDPQEALRLQQLLIEEVVRQSLIKEETLHDCISRKAEWYIPAKEALALKLADGYYK